MAKMAYWRDTARTPRFYGIDARATFPLLLFLLHIRWWSFAVAVIATVFFAFLERYGFRLAVFKRFLRSLMAGKRKVAREWWVS
jgi:intracellular multiplication protein IcmT